MLASSKNASLTIIISVDKLSISMIVSIVERNRQRVLEARRYKTTLGV